MSDLEMLEFFHRYSFYVMFFTKGLYVPSGEVFN